MSIPDWADPILSRDLRLLRAQGEGQALEYMARFPEQARDLAKEIAAFAGSNPGTVLLGVADDGDLVGLRDVDTQEQRDQLVGRIDAVCRGTVKPAIVPAFRWAMEASRTILAIQVPRGEQPVYYCEDIPYVRQAGQSRPAEPHEVIELVRIWLPTQTGQDRNAVAEWFHELSSQVVEGLILADETDERDVNPWLDLWRAQYRQIAASLRTLAADRVAVDRNVTHEFNDVADALESVASFELYHGSGTQFDQLTQRAAKLLREVKRRHLETAALRLASSAEMLDALRAISRQLTDLNQRVVSMINEGEVEEVQTEATQHGYTILHLSYHDVDGLKDGLSKRLRNIGRQLHLVETMPIYGDGGRSLNAVADRIESAAKQLQLLLDQL